jgi:hydrogenase maturation protease
MVQPRRSAVRIAIVAFGDTSAGDSGVSIEVLARMSRDHLPEHAVLINGGTDVLKALESVRGFDGLIVVNAVTMGAAPGTVRTLDLNDLVFSGPPPSVAPNGTGWDSELILAQKFLDLPPTKIVGIQPGSSEGVSISPPLLSKIDRYVEAVREAVNQLRSKSR